MKVFIGISMLLSAFFVSAQTLLVLAPLKADFLRGLPTQDPDLMILHKVLTTYPGKVKILEMSWSRAEVEVLELPGSCIPVRKSASREHSLNFSLPYKVLSAPKLVIRKDSKYRDLIERQYKQNGTVRLAELMLAAEGPVLGVDQTRSYGTEIDQIILRYKDSQSIYIKANLMKVTAGSVPMLLKGHVDMVVEYSMSIDDHSEIIAYPLAETGRFVPLYFACSKTTVGKSQMALLNKTIGKLAANTQYQQMMLNVVEVGDRSHAIAYWQALLAEQKQPELD